MTLAEMPVIGTITYDEPFEYTTNHSDYAAWSWTYEVPAGTYDVVLSQPNTFYARSVARVEATCVSAYSAGHFGGVPIGGGPPQHKDHADVGTKRLLPIGVATGKCDLNPEVVEWNAWAYPRAMETGGYEWCTRLSLRNIGDPVEHASGRDKCWRLFGALEGLNVVSCTPHVLTVYAKPGVIAESWYSDAPERLYLEDRHEPSRAWHALSDEEKRAWHADVDPPKMSLLSLICDSRNHYGSKPSLAKWATWGITPELLDRWDIAYDRTEVAA